MAGLENERLARLAAPLSEEDEAGIQRLLRKKFHSRAAIHSGSGPPLG